MGKKLNADSLVKKLKSVSNTQDSIPMFSLWIIHNKTHHRLIAEQWLQVLKQSKHAHRLTLLYLCNDVVQNCSRKNAPIYKESFSEVLPEAITHLRDSSIRTNVQRVIKIWSKRTILDADFTDQLLAALLTNKPPESLRNKLLVEYKTSHLIEEIKRFKALEDEIEADQNHLQSLRVDVSSTEAIRKLKDKVGGERFSKDFEESASQVESFLQRLEKFVEQRKQLLELLDQGSVYYHAQYHEAKIVVNAYKNFEGRVNKMKRGLDRVVLNFSSDVEPTMEAVLPDITTPIEQEDMEMSDDDKALGRKPFLQMHLAGGYSSDSLTGDTMSIRGTGTNSRGKPSKIVAVDTSQLKSKRETTKLPPNNASTITNATESVLKMLASGLESIQAVPECAEESLKRVVSGIISRPGMRGASSATTTKKPDVQLGSLTITRSIEQNSETLKRAPSPIPGSDSPPSPTGSPELNISSPPRHQSLDSRLADIFNNATPGDAEKGDSDTESDTAEAPITAESASEDPEVLSTTLPGLGGLEEIIEKKPALPEITTLSANLYGASIAATNANVSNEGHNTVTAAAPTALERSNSQAIPVIGGTFRVSSASMDGSSTPTMDEEPYSRKRNAVDASPFPSAAGFLSPPRFSGDALSFLTKFMGQATKTELNAAKPASASLPTAVAQEKDYASWPQTESQVTKPLANISLPWTSNASGQQWSAAPLSTSPVATIPPATPTWPIPTPAIPPPPWALFSSSAGPTPTIPSSQPSFVSVAPSVNDQQSPSKITSSFPPVAPVAKKAKWNSEGGLQKDTDYRRIPPESREASESLHTVSTNHTSVPTAARRNSNLITLSDMAPEPRSANEFSSSNVNEPMTLFKNLLRRKSEEFAGAHSGLFSEARRLEKLAEQPASVLTPPTASGNRILENEIGANATHGARGASGDAVARRLGTIPVQTSAISVYETPIRMQASRNGVRDTSRSSNNFGEHIDVPPGRQISAVSPVRTEFFAGHRPEVPPSRPPGDFRRFHTPERPRRSSSGEYGSNFHGRPRGPRNFTPRHDESFSRPSFRPPRAGVSEDVWLQRELSVLAEDRRRDAVLTDSMFGTGRGPPGGRRDWESEGHPQRNPRPRMFRPSHPPRFMGARREPRMRFR